MNAKIRIFIGKIYLAINLSGLPKYLLKMDAIIIQEGKRLAE